MEKIVALVNSLNPIEKQHFKRRHDSKSDFVLLFDYINKKKTCISAEVLPYLTKKRGSKKAFNSSYLSVIKRYLKDRILESLRIQYIHKRENYELLSRSMNTNILLEKGLYALAKDELSISSKIDKSGSFPIERLLLLRQKSIIDYYENYTKTDIDGIEALFDARIQSAEQHLLEIKFARILSILSYQFFNGIKDTKLLESFMSEPYMMDETLPKEFTTQYLFHWVHAQFQEFKNNAESALEHFNKSMNVWLQNPSYIEAHPRMYLGACYAYLKFLIRQENPFSTILSDINFEVLLSKLNTENLVFEEEGKYRLLFQLAVILSHRKQQQFIEIVTLVNPLLEDPHYLDELANFERVIFCYYAALANFDCGNYKIATDAIMQFLNPVDNRLSKNPLFIAEYILLHLLILCESGNKKHVKTLLPKYKRYLIQEEKLNPFATHFISMVGQLVSDRYAGSLDLVYERYFVRLTEVHEKGSPGNQIEHEYFLEWVRRKKEQEDLLR